MLRGHFRLQVRHLSPPTCGRKAGVPAGQQPRSEAAEFVRLYREMSEPRAVGGMCLPQTHLDLPSNWGECCHHEKSLGFAWHQQI